MFGMGGSEILVILIVALIFLGPDKLPDAAKKISKGLRDLRKHTRQIQDSIENDTQVGGAIRDLKSALRGDEMRAPFEDMRRQVNSAISGAGTPNAAATTPVSTSDEAQPPGVRSDLAAPPDDAKPGDAEPVFRPPADTLAKGAPLDDASDPQTKPS
ncbi:MAG: twin-arginine translocase TatA/TatE family subunit [Myxococcales bacterium]|nr:twin-arginine translocase TatA/TatE family subunit [Myxococcales bacterium]